MKRIWACIAIVIAILCLTGYSSYRVRTFADEISATLNSAETALAANDYTDALKAVTEGEKLCKEMRHETAVFLKTEDFIELEANLAAVSGYLETKADEEALGELRRAAILTENLDRLSRRWL